MPIIPLSEDPHGDYLSPPMPLGAYYADDVDYGWPIMCVTECGDEADCECAECHHKYGDRHCEACCKKQAAAA